MRALMIAIVGLIGAASASRCASGVDGPESYTPAPWAAACAPSASFERAPAWFKGFGETEVRGRVEGLAEDGAGLELLSGGICSQGPLGGESESELAVVLGFCVGETWSSVDLDLGLEAVGETVIRGAGLALRPASNAAFVELPSTLLAVSKLRLQSAAFSLAGFQDPLTGEVEVLLRVRVAGPVGGCLESGGQGVSVRSVSLGVPGG